MNAKELIQMLQDNACPHSDVYMCVRKHKELVEVGGFTPKKTYLLPNPALAELGKAKAEFAREIITGLKLRQLCEWLAYWLNRLFPPRES